MAWRISLHSLILVCLQWWGPSQIFSGVENKSVGRIAGIDFFYIRRLTEMWLVMISQASQAIFGRQIVSMSPVSDTMLWNFYHQKQVRKPNGSEVKLAKCSLIIGTGYWVQVLAWSSIAQSVCEGVFSLVSNRCLETSRFKSCIQQRKITRLLLIQISLVCARASKLTINLYITRARCKSQTEVKSSGLNAHSS